MNNGRRSSSGNSNSDGMIQKACPETESFETGSQVTSRRGIEFSVAVSLTNCRERQWTNCRHWIFLFNFLILYKYTKNWKKKEIIWESLGFGDLGNFLRLNHSGNLRFCIGFWLEVKERGLSTIQCWKWKRGGGFFFFWWTWRGAREILTRGPSLLVFPPQSSLLLVTCVV